MKRLLETVTIKENEKGFLFQNGRFLRLLSAGKYRVGFGREIETVTASPNVEIGSKNCRLETLLAEPTFAEKVTVVEVESGHRALHYIDGQFISFINEGKHAYWADQNSHSFVDIDWSNPRVNPEIPSWIFTRLPPHLYTKIEVEPYQKARLYFDRRLEEILESGVYYFWNTPISVTAEQVDMRLMQLELNGQEILTLDKVTLRVNYACSYRIRDIIRIASEMNDYRMQLHTAAQLALREYIGRHRLDEILESKEAMSAFVLEKLREREEELYITIVDSAVKDIILPGEIRDIMNTVLVAEKRAQANVIARREEIASTRSLLNTAKLMEENRTLYRLKEMECVERIFENVGNLTLNGGTNLLEQLTGLLGGRGAEEAK